jgi:hypothetical protein
MAKTRKHYRKHSRKSRHGRGRRRGTLRGGEGGTNDQQYLTDFYNCKKKNVFGMFNRYTKRGSCTALSPNEYRLTADNKTIIEEKIKEKVQETLRNRRKLVEKVIEDFYVRTSKNGQTIEQVTEENGKKVIPKDTKDSVVFPAKDYFDERDLDHISTTFLQSLEPMVQRAYDILTGNLNLNKTPTNTATQSQEKVVADTSIPTPSSSLNDNSVGDKPRLSHIEKHQPAKDLHMVIERTQKNLPASKKPENSSILSYFYPFGKSHSKKA